MPGPSSGDGESSTASMDLAPTTGGSGCCSSMEGARRAAAQSNERQSTIEPPPQIISKIVMPAKKQPPCLEFLRRVLGQPNHAPRTTGSGLTGTPWRPSLSGRAACACWRTGWVPAPGVMSASPASATVRKEQGAISGRCSCAPKRHACRGRPDCVRRYGPTSRRAEVRWHRRSIGP
jgi:hypothetical protein